jgi:protein-export membrane protein SecD/preprotein translocase SecF subunit
MVMLALVTLMTVVSALYVWPGWPKRYLPDFIDYPEGPLLDLGRDAMRLGLDLQGGTYVLTKADTSALPPGTDIDAAMEGVEDVIERRVNATGVAETEVTREGKDRLAVQLPGISPDEAAELIGKTALLEFRTPVRDDSGQVVCIAPDGSEFSVPLENAIEGVNPTTGQKEGQCTSGPGGSVVGLIEWEPATGLDSSGTPRVLTGSFVKPGGAEVIAAVQGCIPACVTLEFTGEGGLLFQQITEDVVGYPLAIYLDEDLISAPAVNQAITGGNAVIEGLEVDEAETLAIQINAGSLPVPLETIQQKEIEATLGEETLVKGVQAGIIGVMAVMFFMIVYYRLPGILASLALVTYISVVMLVFKIDDPIIGSVTMTLPGIAGFVLSIGMAVDGNILVFERMKEELRAGRTLGPAIEHGFSRAWSSIRDSNVSTLITCAILWWFGDQFGADPVRSFAITLAIGVVFSMFSAIVVTRTLLRTVVATPLARRLDLFVPRGGQEAEVPASEERKPFVFDFVKRRALYFAISAVILIPGIVSLLIPPSLEPGIDFTSGATFTIDFEDSEVSAGDVQDAFTSAGHDEARVQKTSDGEFIVRTSELEGPSGPPVGPAPPSERDEIEAALADQLGPFTITNFNQVSEIVSQEIVGQAAIALAFAAVAILVYLIWSFRNIPKSYRYGIAAVIAAAHDALIILGAFSIFGKLFGTEINREFIAALLTVIGFSVHDTIVVFDRLREKISANPDVPFDELANASLTETIARSINTSTTVLFTVVALLVLGTGSIDVLLIAFLIGVVAGTYSSIFIATQIVVAWEDGDFSRLWRRFVPHRQPHVPAPEPS